MFPILKYLAMITMMLGTIITLSFPSIPLIAWLGLELNSLSFIPLLKNKNNPSSNESMMKYFLIQTISSSLFLIPTLFLSNHTINLIILPNSNSILSIIMLSALLMKLGMPPFHFWMFPLINTIKWIPFILMSTWQKIAPLFVMTYSSSKLITLSILISTLISPIMMFNQNSIKMILGYASIIHLAWMLASLYFGVNLLSQYIMLYIIIFIPTSLIFSFFNIHYLPQISFLNNKYKFLLLINTLSLSGFPPLIMFFSKILVIVQIIQNSSFHIILLSLLLSSLLATYTYIYLNFPFLSTTLNIFTSQKISLNFPPMLFIIFFPLLTIPLILLMLN